MKKLALFPCNCDGKVLLAFNHLLKDYEITILSDFWENETRLQEWAAQYGIHASTEIGETLEKVDALLLLDNEENMRTEKYHRFLQAAQQRGKGILLSPALSESLQIPPSEEVVTLYNPYPTPEGLSINKHYQVTVPVIAVMGMGQHCDKFETLLLMKNALEQRKYAPACFTANPLGSLFGMYNLPQALFDEHTSLENKVLTMNHLAYQMCKDSPPDVIIVEIPGGIIRIGDKEQNHYGEIPLAIANALPIDLGIMNLYFYPNIKEEEMEQFRLVCKMKYDIDVQAFLMSRQKIEYDDELLRFEYLQLEDDLRKRLMPLHSSGPADIGDTARIKRMLGSLVDLLEGNLAAI